MTKYALVTGANSGIGRELALQFANRGFIVYATDIGISPETAEIFRGLDTIQTDTLDVTKFEDISRVKARIVEETDGSLDYLYLNAGLALTSHAADITDEQIDKVFNVNLFSNIVLVRELVKLVINTKGTIVFSGSVTQSLPMHSNALYASSKAGLNQYAYVLHCELKNYGVKVHNVVGGAIKTPIFPNEAGKVPQGSIYDFPEYKKIYADRAKVITKIHDDAMPVAVFAQKTLDKIERSGIDTFQIYEGKKAGTLWFAGTFLSAKLVVKKYLSMFGLDFNYRTHLKDDRFEVDK